MLLASVIQGQVVAVYNTEKQEACRDHETPQSTSSPQTASFQQTVCYSQGEGGGGKYTLLYFLLYLDFHIKHGQAYIKARSGFRLI